MNKRYIDFVPKTKKTGTVSEVAGGKTRVTVKKSAVVTMPTANTIDAGRAPVRRSAVAKKSMTVRNATTTKRSAARGLAAAKRPMVSRVKRRGMRPEEMQLEEIFAEKPEEAGVQKFGVIEDFSGKFVSTEVEKRPLSRAQMDATEAKSKKIPRISLLGKAKKEAKPTPAEEMDDAMLVQELITEEKPAGKKANAGATPPKMKIPERPFVNMEKVEKRPLSRNTYQPRKVVAAPKEEPQGPITIIEKPEKDSRIGLIVTIIITIILGAAAGTVAFLLLPK